MECCRIPRLALSYSEKPNRGDTETSDTDTAVKALKKVNPVRREEDDNLTRVK